MQNQSVLKIRVPVLEELQLIKIIKKENYNNSSIWIEWAKTNNPEKIGKQIVINRANSRERKDGTIRIFKKKEISKP